MDYSFPLPSTSELVERVASVPPNVPVRRWVLRDDNRQQYEGSVPLADDPAYLELRWKPSVRGQEQLVGVFRLHLARLADGGYVSSVAPGGHREVLVRFHRGERGVVSIEPGDGSPTLPVGVVDATLG